MEGTLLLLLLAAVCHPALTSAAFEVDDYRYLNELRQAEAGRPQAFFQGLVVENRWDENWWISEATFVRFLRPLVLPGYAADRALWGETSPGAAGFLPTNLLLHALASLLVWGCFRRLLGRGWPAWRRQTKSDPFGSRNLTHHGMVWDPGRSPEGFRTGVAKRRRSPFSFLGGSAAVRGGKAHRGVGSGARRGSQRPNVWLMRYLLLSSCASAPLSATREELQFLRGLHDQALEWKATFTQLDGKAATEEAVRAALAGKRYLHLATHGYFEPDGLPSLMASAAGEGPQPLGEEKRAVGLLPGLLSGLVFAGVNAEPDPKREDGYLSAEEILYLDLSACDLAMLSACETALGSERAGEGLQSLRRGFAVAGAKTVVSSLWKVDDRATATLMGNFYENYWQKGMEKLEALHAARLRMLRQNLAEDQGDPRPSTWGAFVLSGDWR